MLAKPNKVFNKTNKNANQKHQSSFICKTVFIFPYFIVFFSYTQLVFVLFFISSGRFLYCLWPYCRFLFFSSSEKSSYFLRAFFWNLSFIFLIISSLWIFRHFYIWKNIYIKKATNVKKMVQDLLSYYYYHFLWFIWKSPDIT